MKTKTSKLLKLNSQHGYVMLALLLIFVITGSTFVLAGLNNRQSSYLKNQNELHIQMEAAKAALLSYAANSAKLYNNTRGPGFFPCPDTNNDGQPESTCNYDTAIVGRLPEYQDFSGTYFRFNDAYAHIDQQFWYVAAPRYLYNSTTSKRRSHTRTYSDYDNTITPNTTASNYWLKLDGQTKYVAFIIAPGEELSTQDRSSGPTSSFNYLDGQNGSDGFNFYTGYNANTALFNDQILGITLDEYMVAVGTAVAKEIKIYLDAYNATGSNTYPPDSGSITYSTSASCSGTTYSNIFDSKYVWLRDNTSGNNGERWSCAFGTYWDRDASNLDLGILKFNGCPYISFTFVYGGGITRRGRSCSTLLI